MVRVVSGQSIKNPDSAFPCTDKRQRVREVQEVEWGVGRGGGLCRGVFPCDNDI